MRRFLILVTAAAAAVILSSSPGLGADLKQVVAALEQGYNSLKDVRADFKQRTEITSMKRKESGGGELFIKKGKGNTSMFRFDYKRPLQEIVSDGRTAWYYLPENRQVMVTEVGELFAGNNGIALNYLTGMGHLSRDFTISFAGNGRDDKGNYLLELVPKRPNPSIARLQLTVSGELVEACIKGDGSGALFPVLSSVVDDNFGNRTSIDLSRIRVNRGIADSVFTFRIPKGVEVIRSR